MNNQRPSIRQLTLSQFIASVVCAIICIHILWILPTFHKLLQTEQQQQQRRVAANLPPFPLHASSLSSSSSSLQESKNINPSKEDYDVALLRLRCFTTPGCFPSVKCKKGQPQKIKREEDKGFEEQSFCIQDLHHESKNSNEKCLVYSFGIYDSWAWEASVASMFGCEVHAFDPTVVLPDNLAPDVTFHQLGLQGEDTDMSEKHSDRYRAINKDRLLSLEDIRKKLGHENRSIDVLMLDCEGCEWGVLRQLICKDRESSHMVKQIMTEFHFQVNLGLHDKKHVMIAADAVSCLEKDRWAVTSVEQSGAGYTDMEYVEGVSTVINSKGFLMFMTLRRIPISEMMPHELMEDEANAARAEELKMFEYMESFGLEREKWPGDFAELNQKRKEATRKLRTIFQSRRNFDKHGYAETSEGKG